MRLMAALLLFVVGCSSDGQPARTPALPTATPRDAGYITAAEFGDAWPFTVPAGTLTCTPSGKADGRLLVTFGTGDGIEYGINGSARDFGFPDPDETIVTDYPDLSGLDPIIERGLRLCD
jgi:hypothetical protein